MTGEPPPAMGNNGASSVDGSVRVAVAPSYGRRAARFQGINFCGLETFRGDGRVLTSPSRRGVYFARSNCRFNFQTAPTPKLSSSGLTGRSSTPRPLDYSQASLEYWVARSSPT